LFKDADTYFKERDEKKNGRKLARSVVAHSVANLNLQSDLQPIQESDLKIKNYNLQSI